MRPLRVALAGLRTTFVVHVIVGVAALFGALPIAAMLESAMGDHPDADAVLFANGASGISDVALGWGAALRAGLVAPLLAAVLVAVVSAPLTCAWIAAFGRGVHGAKELVRHAFDLGLRAWLLDGLLFVVRALVVALAIALVALVGAIAIELTDDRTALLSAMGAGLLAASLLVPVGAAADIARAHVALSGRRVDRATWSALRVSFRRPARTTLVYLAISSAAVALTALALLSGEWLAGTSLWAAASVLVVQQALLLARTVLRSVWLAYVATLNEAPSEKP